MKRRVSLWVLFTTTAFAVAVLVFTPAGEAVADSMRPLLVQIVNDSSAPVPVTGATSISGTADVNVVSLPAVQAQQSGAWNVGITGTPTVNIANPNVPVVGTVSVSNLPSTTVVRGRISAFSLAIGDFSAETAVMANTQLTDIVAKFTHSPGAGCAVFLFDSATSELLLSYALPQAALHALNLTTGLQGPLTIRVLTSGTGGDTCGGELVWTGVSQ